MNGVIRKEWISALIALIAAGDGPEAVPLLPVAAVRLPGRHQLFDVLAAAAVGCLAGVPPAAMRRAVEGFTGLEHALERVGEIEGVAFVNDSKATNIEAARRSVESFDAGVVAIMGGRFKGGRFEDLREAVSERVRAIVAIGEAQPLIAAALGGLVPIEAATSLLISLKASDRPIEAAMPVELPNPTASEAAPAMASILDESTATTSTLSAVMPALPSPSMAAFTSVRILFSAYAPAPLAATPTCPPPPTPTAPASTIELMLAVSLARTVRSSEE